MVLSATRPRSKSPPTILSKFMKREITFDISVFCPSIAQVTLVPPGPGTNVKVAVLVAANGLLNSSLIPTFDGWLLSTIVIRPSPTSLFPAQAYIAPVPAGGPESVRFICGSFFSYGDHDGQARKSFT